MAAKSRRRRPPPPARPPAASPAPPPRPARPLPAAPLAPPPPPLRPPRPACRQHHAARGVRLQQPRRSAAGGIRAVRPWGRGEGEAVSSHGAALRGASGRGRGGRGAAAAARAGPWGRGSRGRGGSCGTARGGAPVLRRRPSSAPPPPPPAGPAPSRGPSGTPRRRSSCRVWGGFRRDPRRDLDADRAAGKGGATADAEATIEVPSLRQTEEMGGGYC